MTALVHSWISGWSDWACPSILRPSTTTSAPSRSRAASITSTAPQKYVKLLSPVAKQATLCPLALMRSNCKVVLQDYFVVAPCGTTEKDHIPSIAKAGRTGVSGIEEGSLMPSLLDKASEDFRESFRVAGRGAVNNQYFAHDVLHDETVLSLHIRSFWLEKAMRTREAEKQPRIRKFSLPDAEGLLPRGGSASGWEAGPTTSRLLCRFLGNSLTGDGILPVSSSSVKRQ